MMFHLMAKNINTSLQCLTDVYFVQNLHSSSTLHTFNYNINWWNIGSEFSSEPALGWYYVTFFIFISLLLYYSKSILKHFFLIRSIKTKKNIDKSLYFHNFLNRKLSKYNKRVQLINFEIKDAIFSLFSKEKFRRVCSNIFIKEYIYKIDLDTKKILDHTIQTNKIELKVFIINSLMLKIRQLSLQFKENNFTEEYTRRILHDILRLRDKIK